MLEQLGGDFGTADYWREQICKDPEDPDAWECLGGVYAAAGQLESAVHAYGRAGELAPEWFRPFQARGQLLIALGRFGEAAGELWRAVELQPKNPGLRQELGYALMEIGFVDAAGRQFLQAALLDSGMDELACESDGSRVRSTRKEPLHSGLPNP